MKFIDFDNMVSKDDENYINKNVFVPQHVSNTIIIGQTGCSKTNLLFNILTLNPVFQRILIFTKEPEAKYNFLIKISSRYKNFFIKMMNMILIN